MQSAAGPGAGGGDIGGPTDDEARPVLRPVGATQERPPWGDCRKAAAVFRLTAQEHGF